MFAVFEKTGGGIRTLNMLIVLVDWYSSSWYIYTKDISILTTDYCAIFEVWCKLQVCHAPLCSIFKNNGCGFPTMIMLIILWTDLTLFDLY